MRDPRTSTASAMRRTRRAALLFLALTAAADVVLHPPALLQAAQDAVILATTTSTYDTGLLDALVPPFEKRSGLRVKVISVGSGQALALGKRGEADLVLAHAPAAEEKFMAEGAGVLRLRVMYNDFVVAGPPADPAAVRASRGVAEALRSLKQKGAPFVSRGDDSGTHQLEKKLWDLAGGAPSPGPGYLEAGQGMGATLRVASGKEGVHPERSRHLPRAALQPRSRSAVGRGSRAQEPLPPHGGQPPQQPGRERERGEGSGALPSVAGGARDHPRLREG
jgi:tungstate transport system substrate-binding protein